MSAGSENVTLAILAGGTGSRMGMPKAKLCVGGTPILSWLLKRLNWPGPKMLVTAPAIGAIPGASDFDYCVSDPMDGQGPLRGILTALQNLHGPMVAAITVDMPGIGSGNLCWLIDAIGQRPALAGMMCRVRSHGQERIEPFPSVFRPAAIEPIRGRLDRGARSVHDLLNDPQFAAAAAPAEWPLETWINLNTPKEFAAFEGAEEKLERPV